MKAPSKAEIARALGVSQPAASRYFKRGCPTFSIAAALQWQRQHVDPTQRLLRDTRRAAAASSSADSMLAEIARVVAHVEAKGFPAEAETYLRALLQHLPHEARPRVRMSHAIWRALWGEALIAACQGDPDQTPLSAEEAAHADDVLFEVAAGLRQFREAGNE